MKVRKLRYRADSKKGESIVQEAKVQESSGGGAANCGYLMLLSVQNCSGNVYRLVATSEYADAGTLPFVCLSYTHKHVQPNSDTFRRLPITVEPFVHDSVIILIWTQRGMFKRHQLSTPITKYAATRQNTAESCRTFAKTSAVF
jgi:hypothetical protein